MTRALFLLIFFFGSLVAADTEPPKIDLSDSPDVTWQVWDFGEKYLVFIPESVFGRVPLQSIERLPLPPNSADAIRQTVRWSRDQAAAGRDHCSDGIMGDVPAGESFRVREGLELLAAARDVVVGTVDGLTSGISVSGEASTLIHVAATRVLKSDSGIHAGDHVTLLEDMGRANIAGTEVCTRKQFYRLPRMGEEIVAGGNPDPVNPGHFDGFAQHAVFFVRKGMVERGAEAPEDWKPISLEELAKVLR